MNSKRQDGYNNLIEAFYHKLYMRGRPGHRLDGEVYLVEIVLRDINFPNFE
jgi:hypothetical protein